MSNLYVTATVDNGRSTVSRRAHKNISVHARGWDSGVRVEIKYNPDNTVTWEVYRTAGSNGGEPDKLLAINT